jgi:hypothetical protein
MGEILPMSREKHYEVTSFMLLHDMVILSMDKRVNRESMIQHH